MAPDKIYMPNELLTEEWQRHIEGEDTAYIRKDALLEWAKERKQELLEQELENDEPSDVAAGINAGFDMIIGKLNSM